jgi:hypothetical protein
VPVLRHGRIADHLVSVRNAETMRPFRFRAEAALQLRRREHDRALVTLARAQAAFIAAEEGVATAAQAVDDADRALQQALQTPDPQLPLGWYRSWRLKVREDLRAAETRRDGRDKDVREAAGEVRRSRQRVRSLERLRELALAAWERESRRGEQRTMDALAALRYARRDERTFQ